MKTDVLKYRTEAEQVVELIMLGARLQMMDYLGTVSRQKKISMYRQITGESPAKGMFPSSPEWFISGKANAHASCYYAIYKSLDVDDKKEKMIKAYKIYRNLVDKDYSDGTVVNKDVIFSINRAWIMLRLIDAKALSLVKCKTCKCSFVNESTIIGFECVYCNPPSRLSIKKNTK